jgi:fucose 4-O-acetylase-like acetyltransferase
MNILIAISGWFYHTEKKHGQTLAVLHREIEKWNGTV